MAQIPEQLVIHDGLADDSQLVPGAFGSSASSLTPSPSAGKAQARAEHGAYPDQSRAPQYLAPGDGIAFQFFASLLGELVMAWTFDEIVGDPTREENQAGRRLSSRVNLTLPASLDHWEGAQGEAASGARLCEHDRRRRRRDGGTEG